MAAPTQQRYTQLAGRAALTGSSPMMLGGALPPPMSMAPGAPPPAAAAPPPPPSSQQQQQQQQQMSDSDYYSQAPSPSAVPMQQQQQQQMMNQFGGGSPPAIRQAPKAQSYAGLPGTMDPALLGLPQLGPPPPGLMASPFGGGGGGMMPMQQGGQQMQQMPMQQQQQQHPQMMMMGRGGMMPIYQRTMLPGAAPGSPQVLRPAGYQMMPMGAMMQQGVPRPPQGSPLGMQQGMQGRMATPVGQFGSYRFVSPIRMMPMQWPGGVVRMQGMSPASAAAGGRGVPMGAGNQTRFAVAYSQYARMGQQYRNMWMQQMQRMPAGRAGPMQKVAFMRTADGRLIPVQCFYPGAAMKAVQQQQQQQQAMRSLSVTNPSPAAGTPGLSQLATTAPTSRSAPATPEPPPGEDEDVKAPKNRQSTKELKEWDKAWEKVVKKMPLPDGSPQPIASLLTHMRGIMSFDKHQLNEIFNHAIDICASDASAVKDVGSDDARQQLLGIIVSCLQKLVPALMTFYKTLKPRQQWVEDGVIELLFQRLHSITFKQYAARYKDEDDQHVAKFKAFNFLTPAHLGINKRFWLTEERSIAPNTPVELLPYGESIAILRQLPTLDTPGSRVQCLADAGKAIYAAVIKFWGDRLPPEKLEITADEFLPLFAYATVRSQVENPYSTCKYINDFMSEKESIGEKGYSLVTFETCLSFILELNNDELKKTIAAAFGEQSPPETNPLIARMVPEDVQENIAQQQQQETTDVVPDSATSELQQPLSQPAPVRAAPPPPSPTATGASLEDSWRRCQPTRR